MAILDQVDAFTETPFAGNPAAVCVLEAPAPEAWMRAVAREMNLSETAFLVPAEDGFWLRWFTPASEVDLCGHATLASAHTLWERGMVPPAAAVRFHTRSGVLLCARRDGWIEMDFPALPPVECDPPPGLLAALGLDGARWIGRSRFDVLVVVDGEETVRGLEPRFDLLHETDARGVIVTSLADGANAGVDFVSRFFAPRVGIPEDPATGSAHCVLGPWWAEQLERGTLSARQLSSRGGELRLRVGGFDDEVPAGRVLLGGRAVTVLRGELAAVAAEEEDA